MKPKGSHVGPKGPYVGPSGPTKAARTSLGPRTRLVWTCTEALGGPEPGSCGGAPPVGPMGPQGPQEGTGSLPGGSPGQGEHGEEVRGDFWKTRFLGPRRPPVKPRKTASKQAPQPPGPISIDPFCFFAPGGSRKSLECLRGDPIRAKSKADRSQYFAQAE